MKKHQSRETYEAPWLQECLLELPKVICVSGNLLDMDDEENLVNETFN